MVLFEISNSNRQLVGLTVSPSGYTDTPGFRAPTNPTGDEKVVVSTDQVPLGRIAQAEEIGKLIVWLLSEESSYVNAEVVKIDGGWLG